MKKIWGKGYVMLKRFVFFLLFFIIELFILADASAQEIKIGDAYYPIIILLPIFIILLSIIFFVIYLILNSLKIPEAVKKFREIGKMGKKMKRKIRYEKKEREQKKKLEEMKKKEQKQNQQNKKSILSIMNSSLKKEQKGNRIKNTMGSLIVEEYMRRLLIFERKEKGELEDKWKDFSKITQDFFKEYLGLDYEFTNIELEKELVKRGSNQMILNFIRELEKQYAETLSEEELSNLIYQLKEILEYLEIKEIGNLSDLLKERAKNMEKRLAKGLNNISQDKMNAFIKLVEEWEKSHEKNEKSIMLKSYYLILSLSKDGRRELFKEFNSAYEKQKPHLILGTKLYQKTQKLRDNLEQIKGLRNLPLIPTLRAG